MSLAVSCPECDHSFSVGDEMAGKRGRCPQCGGLFRVDEPPDGPAEAAAGFTVDVDRPKRGRKARSGGKKSGKKKRKMSSPEPAGEKSSGVSVWVWAAGALVGVILLCGGGYMVLAGGDKPTARQESDTHNNSNTDKKKNQADQDSDGKDSKDSAAGKDVNQDATSKVAEKPAAKSKPAVPPPIDFKNDIVPAIARLVPYFKDKPIEGGTGSGFFVNDQQWIVTNHHVVKYADAVKVMVAGNDTLYDIEGIVAQYRRQDIVIIKPKQLIPGVKTLTLAPDVLIANADRIYVTGNPYMNCFVTTRGVVTRKVNRSRLLKEGLDLKPKPPQDATPYTMVEYDARVFPGSDGSPVINQQGQVIAMHMSIFWMTFVRPPSIDVMPMFGVGVHARHVAKVVQMAGGPLKPFTANGGKGPPPSKKFEIAAEDKPPSLKGLADKLKAETDKCVARKWTANDEDEYASLARIAAWVTDAKEIQDIKSIPQQDRDKVNEVADAAIKVISEAVGKQLFGSETHTKRINQQATNASPRPGKGIFVVGQVVNADDHSLTMQLIGKDRYILLPASKNIDQVPKQSRWIVLGQYTHHIGMATDPAAMETSLAPVLKVYALIELK